MIPGARSATADGFGGGDGGTAPLPDVVARLLAPLPLGIAFIDADGRVLDANEAMRATAALTPRGQPALESLFVPDDRRIVRRALARVAVGEPGESELRVRLTVRPDEAVPVRVLPVSGLGRAIAALVVTDNREQLRLERQVAQAVRMQAVGQLAGGVAHDFNNILTAIVGHCDLVLARGAADLEDRADIEQIVRNAARAAALVRHLLAFSRQQMLRPRRVVVPEIIAGVVPLLSRLLGETVALDIADHEGRREVRVDPGQLEQVIVNLAINARDAMPGGGRLEICTEPLAAADVAALGQPVMPAIDYVAVRVRDTGTGIPPAVLGKIYEPFFTTKEAGRGTGLGLSTVYGIVKQTGGFIFADNRPEGGAEFAIYLPVDDGTDEGAEDGDERAAEQSGKAVPAGRAAVLLVEDEAAVRIVAERALTRAGHSVTTARDGEEGLELFLADAGAFDMLVSDVAMPGLDGPGLAERVRLARPDMPVLLISGYAEPPARRSLEAPSFALLAKPFSMAELQQAVAETLAAPVS